MDLANQTSTLRDVSGRRGLVAVPIGAEGDLGVRATVWTLAGSYTLARSPVATFDVLAGVRYAGMRTSLGFRNLSYDQSGDKPVQNVNMTGPLIAVNFRW